MRIPFISRKIDETVARQVEARMAPALAEASTKAYDAALFGQLDWGHTYGLSGYGLQTGNMYLSLLKAFDPMQNSLVMAGMRLLVANLETIRWGVVRPGAPPDAEINFNHPAIEVLDDPGNGFSRRELLWLICESLLVAGNCVLIPQPNYVQAVDWRNLRLPQSGMYDYEVQDHFYRHWFRYQPEQVAHLRHHRGVDGINGVGIFPQSLLDEMRTDYEAETFALTVLRRSAAVNLLFTPGDTENEDYTQEDAENLIRQMSDRYSGPGRGGIAAVSKSWTMHEPTGAVGNKLDLSHVRNVCEERILSTMGIPPALLGIGTGAQQTRVGRTLEALRAQYAAGTLMPLAVLIAEQLTTHYLPFYAPPGAFEIRPDYSNCTVVAGAEFEALAQQKETEREIQRALRSSAPEPDSRQAPPRVDEAPVDMKALLAPVNGNGHRA